LNLFVSDFPSYMDNM